LSAAIAVPAQEPLVDFIICLLVEEQPGAEGDEVASH
jgi:hypothetical protein